MLPGLLYQLNSRFPRLVVYIGNHTFRVGDCFSTISRSSGSHIVPLEMNNIRPGDLKPGISFRSIHLPYDTLAQWFYARYLSFQERHFTIPIQIIPIPDRSIGRLGEDRINSGSQLIGRMADPDSMHVGVCLPPESPET